MSDADSNLLNQQQNLFNRTGPIRIQNNAAAQLEN